MIIGITGTNGAGKGTVVDYLVRQKGFTHYLVRKYIEEEVKKRGMPMDRNSTNIVGNDMREKHGFDYWDKLIFADVEKNGDRNIIIDSIRNLASAEQLRAQGAQLWAVDADKPLRYKRVTARGNETDHVTFEQFVEQEDREMHQTAKHDMNIFAVMQLADVTLTNNGALEDLYGQVEGALKQA